MAGAQHRQDEVDADVFRDFLAEDVQSAADRDVLNLAQPAVNVHEHVVEDVFGGAFFPAEVFIHLGGGEQRPNLLADRG